jgi:phytoene/squalene synthetase
VSAPWTAADWRTLELRVSACAGKAPSDEAALATFRKAARQVLRAFSSSFFLVTRFLPPAKRAAVEIIYAAVRYPDEIVDTFPLSPDEKLAKLAAWESDYDNAIALDDVRQRLNAGTPWILAGFADVVRRAGIPERHYRDFLTAMRRDAAPARFATLDELINDYVYGSAIAVGYFLAHVYGTAPGSSLEDAYRCAADLGIALQLTNFARDIPEDRGRSRVYVPEGVEERDGAAFLARAAEDRYGRAARELRVFAEDCRPAVRACIEVYRRLNHRILKGSGEGRLSVPAREKFGALPPSKYWRVPLAYLGTL